MSSSHAPDAAAPQMGEEPKKGGRWMRRIDLISLALVLPLFPGCGPTVVPAFVRVGPEQQAQIDASWKNMLTPTDRLDRELLLDVMLVYQLHQLGIDHATYEADKEFADGTIHMRVTFDRAKPLDDHF